MRLLRGKYEIEKANLDMANFKMENKRASTALRIALDDQIQVMEKPGN